MHFLLHCSYIGQHLLSIILELAMASFVQLGISRYHACLKRNRFFFQHDALPSQVDLRLLLIKANMKQRASSNLRLLNKFSRNFL